jgi:hypothetical protein
MTFMDLASTSSYVLVGLILAVFLTLHVACVGVRRLLSSPRNLSDPVSASSPGEFPRPSFLLPPESCC